jgi:integrase
VVIWVRGKCHEYIVVGTRAEAEAFEARKRLELDATGLSKRVAPTFSDFCLRQYAQHAETNLKDTTWHQSRKYQVANLIEFFGALKLTAISTEDVERFKRARLGNVGPTTVNNELRLLGTILRYAAALGYPASAPQRKKLKPRGQGRVRPWTEDELARLFLEARKESETLLRLFVFLTNTGCRKGEAIAVEWSWVDLDAGMIRIPSNRYWQPKNGLPREVPISDACRAVLTGPRQDARWAFPNRKGARYAQFPKDLFWRARKRAGVPGGVHTFRHTFASHFLQQVPDLFLLAQVLGHSHQRVTELYAHLLPGHLERARNAVNLGPRLQTMAATMAKKRGAPRERPRKAVKRH